MAHITANLGRIEQQKSLPTRPARQGPWVQLYIGTTEPDSENQVSSSQHEVGFGLGTPVTLAVVLDKASTTESNRRRWHSRVCHGAAHR